MNDQLRKNIKDSLVTIIVVIVMSYLAFRLGVWNGENNIARKYNIDTGYEVYNVKAGEVEKVMFRLFD